MKGHRSQRFPVVQEVIDEGDTAFGQDLLAHDPPCRTFDADRRGDGFALETDHILARLQRKAGLPLLQPVAVDRVGPPGRGRILRRRWNGQENKRG